MLDELGLLPAVSTILDVICRTTGMGFAAVAHVSEARWVACSVLDKVAFGLEAGGELPVETTLCNSVRNGGDAIVIDDVASHPLYCDHHTPAIYGLQSYIAFPIWLAEGEFFGTLCAIDAAPKRVDTPEIRGMFDLFAQLIGTHVDRITGKLEKLALTQSISEALNEKKVYSDIVETSTAAITAIGLNWQILAINRANVEAFYLAYGKKPKVGDDLLSLFADSPDHIEQQRVIWSRALSGETFVVIDEFGADAFQKRHYEVRFSPLLNADGERIGASSTSYDVTARVEAERQLASIQAQLQQAQKMEAMGQLTGGVAHDFNNLLTPIIGSLDMLQRHGFGSAREERLVNAALQSAERARTLVQRLLAFARRQPLKPTAVDIGELMHDLTELITGALGAQIALVNNIGAELPPVRADRHQLEMALLNLAVNARDAMPNGGTLRISAAKEHVPEGSLQGLVAGEYVSLSVADTGSGMDEATLAHAIEPFFSTKGIGRGTGLGLSMADGLARQLGGALKLSSSVGYGTTVTLYLPATELHEVKQNGKLSQGESGSKHVGSILLIDDEELVRFSIAEMLLELGYEIVEAASGEEGLRLLRGGLQPSVVVTDHLMPGISGMDLARILADECPLLPVLIVSGYSEAKGLPHNFNRLTKPFRQLELSACLAQLLRLK